MATTTPQHLPHSFFCRPAELVAPERIGCLLVKLQQDVSCCGIGDTPLRQASPDFKDLKLGLIFES